ncbi:MAG: ABC transporter permease subunit [Pseudomonadota bacterium]|nr:ABC transporter permease subunit [Pseudomonadota bacterium]
MLPLLMSSQPLLVLHNNTVYFPSIYSYLESDLGGVNPIVADFNESSTRYLIPGAKIIYPLYSSGLAANLNQYSPFAPISSEHWLGTNHLGHDIWVYSIYALLYSILLPMILTITSACIGRQLGVASAAYGGIVDFLFLTIYEICRSISFTLLVVISLKQSMSCFLSLFACTQWTKFAHLSRNETLQLLEKPYVQDAIYAGTSKHRLIKNHLLPAVTLFWQNQLPHTFLNYLALHQSLEYFGMNLIPGAPSLGGLLLQIKQHPDGMGMLIIALVCFTLATTASYQIFPRQKELSDRFQYNNKP